MPIDQPADPPGVGDETDSWSPDHLPSLEELNQRVGVRVILRPQEGLDGWMREMERLAGFDYSVFQVFGMDALLASMGSEWIECCLKKPWPTEPQAPGST